MNWLEQVGAVIDFPRRTIRIRDIILPTQRKAVVERCNRLSGPLQVEDRWLQSSVIRDYARRTDQPAMRPEEALPTAPIENLPESLVPGWEVAEERFEGNKESSVVDSRVELAAAQPDQALTTESHILRQQTDEANIGPTPVVPLLCAGRDRRKSRRHRMPKPKRSVCCSLLLSQFLCGIVVVDRHTMSMEPEAVCRQSEKLSQSGSCENCSLWKLPTRNLLDVYSQNCDADNKELPLEARLGLLDGFSPVGGAYTI